MTALDRSPVILATEPGATTWVNRGLEKQAGGLFFVGAMVAGRKRPAQDNPAGCPDVTYGPTSSPTARVGQYQKGFCDRSTLPAAGARSVKNGDQHAPTENKSGRCPTMTTRSLSRSPRVRLVLCRQPSKLGQPVNPER